MLTLPSNTPVIKLQITKKYLLRRNILGGLKHEYLGQTRGGDETQKCGCIIQLDVPSSQVNPSCDNAYTYVVWLQIARSCIDECSFTIDYK